MAEVEVKKRQQAQGREERAVAEPRRGALAPRFPSIFTLTPREIFSMSPFELMRRFTEEMDRAFEGLSPWWGTTGVSTGAWSPPVDVSEEDGNLVVTADLPGLRKEDVKVEVTPEGLWISGERKREREERREGVYRAERSYGSFSRCIPIPEDADIEKARAIFENGVLKISIPIPESARRRREIPIEAKA